MGDFTRLPLPVRDGESAMLRSIAVIDAEDLGKDIDIIFVYAIPQNTRSPC